MVALREILARFGVAFDDSQLKKGDKAIDGVAGKLSVLGKSLGNAVIAAGLYEIGKAAWESVHGLAEQADALAKQSRSLGISLAELQEWQYAANLSGVSAEEMNGALTKFNKNIADAAKGTGPAADAMRALGVKTKDSAGRLRQPIEMLDGIADGLVKIKNPAERTQAVMSLFGKSGAKLLPLFAEGADGIKKLRAEVKELGGGFDEDFAANAERMNDAVSRLNFAWLSFKARFGGLVLPLIERAATVMATKVIPTINTWTKRLDPLLKNTNIVAGAVLALGTAFLVAGVKAIAPWLPLLATLVALAIVADELITFFEGGDSLIGRGLDAAFGKGTQDQVRGWFEGVYKSAKDLFTNTERSLFEFDAGLRLMWHDLTTWMGDVWADLGTGLELMLVDFNAAVRTSIGSVQDSFGDLWNSINDGIDKVPGLRTLLGRFTDTQRAAGGNAAAARAAGDQRRAGILDQSDARRAANAAERQAIIDSSVVARPTVATAPAPVNNVNAPVNVNVTVPPGTPPQQAQNIANVARRAVQQSNSAKINALVRTAG